ncbi:hypothetical protein ABZ922_30080 [Streptomyces shenzhenensis]|uniref:hypothetical protein n=1 Tax=Streptomyces shenzhenensis TaxID=943815 RepID=UPI0033E38DCB
MTAGHRLALLTVPALLALCACGIPATGVVEAGGPASGIEPVTPVYFLRDGALVAVPRATADPGDAGAALDLLLLGPAPVEAAGGLSTEVPEMLTATPATPPAASPVPGKTSADVPTVSVKGDTVGIRLPPGFDRLSRLAAEQLICTAAAARRIGEPSADTVTVTVSTGSGRQAEGTDGNCPGA